MAITGQDSFTDTSATALSAHTPEVGSWTNNNTLDLQINASNQCKIVSTPRQGTYTQASAGSAAHYAQVKFLGSILNEYDRAGPAVRCSGNDCIYAADRTGNLSRINTVVSGVIANIASVSNNIVASDLVRLEASSSDLTMKVNGATIATATSVVNLTAQIPGLFIRLGFNSDPALDDYESGDLAAAAGPSVPRRYNQAVSRAAFH
jgi:hypothetical protein